MTRLYWLTFQGAPRTPAAEHAHESSPVMTVPLMVLAVAATVALILGLPGHTAVSELFQHYLSPVFKDGTARLLQVGHFHEGDHPYWPFLFAWVIAALGTFIAWAMYAGPWKAAPAALAKAFPAGYRLMVDKFRIDELYQFLVIDPLEWLARVLWRVVDVFFIDGIVNGAGKVALGIGRFARLAQNGDLQRYAAIMAVAAGAIIWTVLGTGGP
jgi:NADH-quinone oxidoreductase subunit L